MKKNQWRTVAVAGLGIVSLSVIAGLTGHWTGIGAVYPSFVGGVVACVGAVAAKAYGEHKANAGKPAEEQTK
jgi:hypothetical protein